MRAPPAVVNTAEPPAPSYYAQEDMQRAESLDRLRQTERTALLRRAQTARLARRTTTGDGAVSSESLLGFSCAL